MITHIPEMELENRYTSGVYGKRPVVIVRGSGASLWDADGREYIDCAAGQGVANIGHGRADIANVLATQAQRLITCPEIFYNDVRAHLLERLAQVTPEGLTHFFLCNSGAESVEGAFKFARLATGRTNVIATMRGFHGRTMGALSMTWERNYREPFAPLVAGVSHIRYNDLAAAEAAINEETAAFMIELVQGEGGVHPASVEYVQGLARLCRERGAMLIVDEVQTGFGRTGSLFACEHYGISPDILCLAKSLAGGIPMGVVCLGTRVMESGRIGKGVHGTTFGGNPLACAVALETLAILEREQLAARAATLGAQALDYLRGLASRTPLIREVRGMGLMIGIELRERVQPYLEALLERGVLALPAGPYVLRLLPPLVITEAQLQQVLVTIEDVLTAGRSNPTTESRVSQTTSTLASPQDTQTPEVALLSGMLNIPSYSTQEGALARYLVEQARQLGLQAYIDDAGNFVASVPGETNEHPIVMLGHMDTVPGNIPVRIENGLLYGRGAVDAKGPLAAFICAAARIAQATKDHPSGRPTVYVIGAVEEEAATSRGARAVVNRYQPSACIIGEPSGSRAITIGYKGRLLVEYQLSRPLSHTAGPLQNSSEATVNFWHRVITHATNWNQYHAGDSAFAALTPSLRNINSEQDGLMEQTRLVIGYRLPPGYNIQALRTQLMRWAEEDNAEIHFTGEEVAFQSSRTTTLARTFSRAIRASGEQPTFKLKTGTSDMNVVGPIWGQEIVAYGTGDSSLDHTPQEHIRIDEYMQAIEILERVLGELMPGGER